MPIQTYRTYMFKDKDPVIDKLRTIFDESGMTYGQLARDSGCSEATPRNWFGGETRRPQHASVMAVARAMGWDYRLVKGAPEKTTTWKTRLKSSVHKGEERVTNLRVVK